MNSINLSINLLSKREVESFPPPSTKILVKPNVESFLKSSCKFK